MLVEIENPAVLSKGVDIISELVTEVRIKINEFGLSITAIDPANVAMVNFKVPKSAFSKFEVGNETLGINLESLKGVLRRAGTKSLLTIEKKENLLHIHIQDRIRRNFTISLIDIEGEDKEIPMLDYSSKIQIKSADLVDSVEDCALVGDACSFIVKDGKFLIEARGINSARAEFSSDEATIEAENCKSKYSLEYLQKFMKAAKLTDKTSLRFSNDHPMRMDNKTDHMEITFILAPRVETEN